MLQIEQNKKRISRCPDKQTSSTTTYES